MKKALLVAFLSPCLLTACGSSSPPPPPPAADFSIVISPSALSTQVGGTTSAVTVSLLPQNGFTGTVNVAVSGFPNGINSSPAASFMLTAGTPEQVTFSAPAAAGTFTVEFQGVSGTLSHSANATLTVTAPQNPYMVSASYYPWYNASSWEYAECYNGTLRGELIPAQLPQMSWQRRAIADVVMNAISSSLTIVTVPLAWLVLALPRVVLNRILRIDDNSPLNWVILLLTVAMLGAISDAYVLHFAFKWRLGQQAFWLLYVVNAMTVAFAAFGMGAYMIAHPPTA